MPEPRGARGAHAPGSVAAARVALLRWVDEAGEAGRVFLQLHLRATGPDRYRACHLADRELPAGALQSHGDPFAAREIAQTTAAGEHRPLKTSPNLRRGWLLAELDGRGLWTALDYLYPACARHWHAAREGTLRVTSWQETAARQSGMYAAVGLLPEEALGNAVRACCADAVCLRRVAWPAAPGGAPIPAEDASAREEGEGASVPCPEACSLFVSFARKVLALERAPRQELPGLGAVGPAEMEQIRATLAAAAAGTLGAAREGDFEEPTNQRRLRYLVAMLNDE